MVVGPAVVPPPAAAQPRPRSYVVVILADEMGTGSVSALNPRSIWRTPHIDRLAREGTIFTGAHSLPGVSTPTRYTLLASGPTPDRCHPP